MNICSIMNWIGNYVDFALHGYDYNNAEYDEYDLIEVLLYSGMGIFVTVFIAWWMIPLYVIAHAMRGKIIFKCNKNQ